MLHRFLAWALLAQLTLTGLGPSTPGGQTQLVPADFTLDGYIDVQVNGLDSPSGMGLTHRYVAGDLRLMFMELDSTNGGRVDEISLTGVSFPGHDVVTSTVASHSNIYAGILTPGDFVCCFFSLWWEEATSRLWSAYGRRYITTYAQANIFTRQFSGGGITGLHGPVGLFGMGERLLFGNVVATPTQWQTACGLGAYTSISGGQASAKSNFVSMGSAIFSFPDISGYGNNTEIPAANFKVGANHVSGWVGTDWYAGGSVTSFDRGQRVTADKNYFDSSYVGTAAVPVVDPPTGAQWNGAAPDGFPRWTDIDSYWFTGQWINTATKKGLVYIGAMCGGTNVKCWYGSSDVHAQNMSFELHLYAPETICQSANLTLDPWKVQPVAMADITASLPGLTSVGVVNSAPVAINGGTYDTTDNKYYVSSSIARAQYLRIYRFSVAQ